MIDQQIFQLLENHKILKRKLKLAKRLKRFNNKDFNIQIRMILKYDIITVKQNDKIIHEFMRDIKGKIVENQYYCTSCGTILYRENVKPVGKSSSRCSDCYKRYPFIDD